MFKFKEGEIVTFGLKKFKVHKTKSENFYCNACDLLKFCDKEYSEFYELTSNCGDKSKEYVFYFKEVNMTYGNN